MYINFVSLLKMLMYFEEYEDIMSPGPEVINFFHAQLS